MVDFSELDPTLAMILMISYIQFQIYVRRCIDRHTDDVVLNTFSYEPITERKRTDDFYTVDFCSHQGSTRKEQQSTHLLTHLKWWARDLALPPLIHTIVA